MLSRSLLLAFILLCTGCATPRQAGLGEASESTDPARVSTHEFRFEDDGAALYFVVDKGIIPAQPPQTLIFVVPGSDCLSMAPFLPRYFDGLQGGGPTRIFILHKRFIGLRDDGRNCSPDYVEADHPSRWLADQLEFIAAQLDMARDTGQAPTRIVALGISEGGEVVPLLAMRFAQISHVAIIANGGMKPADSFRLQARRHGFSAEAEAVAAFCARAEPRKQAAGRSCRYWAELFALDHTANLLGLSRPILIAMGEDDALVPAESAHFLAQRFADAGKTNLRIVLFPEANHGFQRKNESLLPYLWEAFDEWMME